MNFELGCKVMVKSSGRSDPIVKKCSGLSGSIVDSCDSMGVMMYRIQISEHSDRLARTIAWCREEELVGVSEMNRWTA